MHTGMRNIYEKQRSSYTYMNKAPQNKSLFFTDPKMHFKKCTLIQKKNTGLKNGIESWKSPGFCTEDILWLGHHNV